MKAKLRIYLEIAILATVAGWFASQTSLGQQIEHRTYDYRFLLKELFPPSSSSVPITIIAVDDNSLEKVPDPLGLWQRHYAELLVPLKDAGAMALGIDVLFAPVDPEGQTALARALLGSKGLPVILAYRVKDMGVVVQPPTELVQAADFGGHGFAYANLTTDSDDFVREQTLQAPKTRQPGLALAVANAFAKRANKPLKFPIGNEPVLIDYLPGRSFPRVSFFDALKAARSNDTAFFRNKFAGRIVLIGEVSDRGGGDLHSTPLYYTSSMSMSEGSRTPGIEIHANTIAMLIDNRSIHDLSLSQKLIVSALSSLAFIFIWGYLRRFSLGSSLVLVTGYAVFVIVMFLHGKSVTIVAPASSASVALVLTFGANYFLEEKEKKRIRNLFSGYVSDAVIAQLLASPEGVILSGERRRVAILFADIKGFTTVSETASPERVVQMLNKYFGAVVDVIQSRGGTVNSLMGDGIMAIFGAPIGDADAALHAVEAAQEMMKALAPVNEFLKINGFDPIGIGIGINSGEAVVGNMGSPKKMEYTAIGDVVNTAARIEGQTRSIDADILISEDAYEWIQGRIAAEFVKDAALKGKGQTVRLYRVPWN